MKYLQIVFSILFLSLFAFGLDAQLLEPYLSSPEITPAPLTSSISSGDGQIKFKLHQVEEDITLTAGDPIVLDISLSNVSPTGGNIAAVSGAASALFDWTYDLGSNVLSGEQVATIPGNLYAGEIIVDFEVDVDTEDDLPQNGFDALITPSSTISSTNNPLNDGISAYTWAGSDITDIMTMLPTSVQGLEPVWFTIKVQEIKNVPTDGIITVLLPKDARLTFSYDPGLTMIGPFTVNNAVWDYDGSNSSFHIWTSDDVIAAQASSSFGLEAQYDPQGTTGISPYTVSIISGSGGENDFLNNVDAESLVYFSN